MIEKIKNYVNNLNIIQKILYLVIIFTITTGETFLKVIEVNYFLRDELILGVLIVSIVGILLFRNKKEE
tara:strand:+ start:368 stop:574 length:207 start_codon:yes stop_codon:yes gene_type:complete